MVEPADKKREDSLTKQFIMKRLDIVPLMVRCIVLEMIFMFSYICLCVVCRLEWSSLRQQAMAWLLFFFYVYFWAKLAWSFLITFGHIVRDTKITGD